MWHSSTTPTRLDSQPSPSPPRLLPVQPLPGSHIPRVYILVAPYNRPCPILIPTPLHGDKLFVVLRVRPPRLRRQARQRAVHDERWRKSGNPGTCWIACSRRPSCGAQGRAAVGNGGRSQAPTIAKGRRGRVGGKHRLFLAADGFCLYDVPLYTGHDTFSGLFDFYTPFFLNVNCVDMLLSLFVVCWGTRWFRGVRHVHAEGCWALCAAKLERLIGPPRCMICTSTAMGTSCSLVR